MHRSAIIAVLVVAFGLAVAAAQTTGGALRPSAIPRPTSESATQANEATQGGACIQGFVWREATVADRVCVTPDTRTRTARQNQEASLHRLPDNPNTCMQGFVWREAVGGDIVCVTPGERAQAADDNRQAASRVVQGQRAGQVTSAACLAQCDAAYDRCMAHPERVAPGVSLSMVCWASKQSCVALCPSN
jgi:hypothetical protein